MPRAYHTLTMAERAAIAERRRARYAADPELRARRCAAQRAYRKAHADQTREAKQRARTRPYGRTATAMAWLKWHERTAGREATIQLLQDFMLT